MIRNIQIGVVWAAFIMTICLVTVSISAIIGGMPIQVVFSAFPIKTIIIILLLCAAAWFLIEAHLTREE